MRDFRGLVTMKVDLKDFLCVDYCHAYFFLALYNLAELIFILEFEGIEGEKKTQLHIILGCDNLINCVYEFPK